MRISKKILACVLAALMAISMMPLTVLADEVPEGTVYSFTNTAGKTDYITEAFPNRLENSGTYTLYQDITVSWLITPTSMVKDLTIDLNGHNITSTYAGSTNNYTFLFGGSTLSPRNYSIINSSSTLSTINGSADVGIAVNKQSTNVTFGENIVFNTPKTGVVLANKQNSTACQNTVVTINGTINSASEFGLTVNGSIQTANPAPKVIVNGEINGCTAGIYAAGNADYTINGKVTGHTGIYQKGGNLVVNEGAVVTGTGADAAYVQMSDGMSSTGDAIVVEDNGSYKLGTTVINGGTITSTAAGTNAIAEYDATTAASTAAEQDITVSGGTFVAAGAKDDISKYLIEGATQDANGVVAQTYVAKIGDNYYADFEAAVAAANAGDTITLVSDVDLTNYPAKGQHRINIDGKTIDLNTHKITASGRWGIIFEGNNATIKNGTMEAIDNSDAAGYQYGVYVWGGDGSNNMPDPEQKASVTLEDLTINYGVHTYNADVTIKNCDVTGSSAYYAVWCDIEGNAVIESGNFTTGGAAVVGTAQYQNSYFGQIRVDGGNFTVPAGKKLVQTGSSCVPANTKFYGGTVKNADDSVFTVADDNLGFKCTQNMTTGEVSQSDEEVNDGANITVAETISENFYLDEDFYGENAYVAVTYNTNANASETPDIDTEIKAMSSLPVLDKESEYNGNRIVSITQAPAQVTENVEIKVYASQADAQAGTNAVKTISYSTYDYCTNIIENSSDTKLVELAEATLDYAAAAQNYFNYNTSNMATKDATGDFYNDVAGATFENVLTPYFAGLFTSATVVVKSDLEINLLTKKSFNYDGNNYSPVKGGERFAVETLVNGSYNVLHISGIEPANMNVFFTVYTDQGYVDLSANAIMRIMANSGNAKMATLAKAMYLYGQAANAYFG